MGTSLGEMIFGSFRNSHVIHGMSRKYTLKADFMRVGKDWPLNVKILGELFLPASHKHLCSEAPAMI